MATCLELEGPGQIPPVIEDAAVVAQKRLLGTTARRLTIS